MDQRPSAVTVNWEPLAAPWYALYAEAMALDGRLGRSRRAAIMQVEYGSADGAAEDGGGDDVVAKRWAIFGEQGFCHLLLRGAAAGPEVGQRLGCSCQSPAAPATAGTAPAALFGA